MPTSNSSQSTPAQTPPPHSAESTGVKVPDSSAGKENSKETKSAVGEEQSKANGTPEDTAPPAGNKWAFAPHALAIALVIVAFDQWTKWLTLQKLATPDVFGRYPSYQIIPEMLRFIYAENRGAAFSILYGHVELLAAVSVIAVVALVFFFRSLSPKEWVGRFALGMILGGAIGNLYDRVFRGFVVDMIDAYVGEYHWPTFNVADSFICIGMTLLIAQMLRGKI